MRSGQGEDPGDKGLDDGPGDQGVDVGASQHGRDHLCRLVARQPARGGRQCGDQLGQVADFEAVDYRLTLSQAMTGGSSIGEWSQWPAIRFGDV